MANDTNKLTVAAIKASAGRQGKLADGGGLHLFTTATGARLWRLKFRHAGKEGQLAFGAWPEVSLAEARQRREQARAILRDGGNPAQAKREKKAAAKLAVASSFGAIATEWIAKQEARLSEATLSRVRWMLCDLAAPLRDRPIGAITPGEVLAVLREIESRGANETAHRTKQRIGLVFRYAISTGRATADPTTSLKGALTPVTTTSRAAITNRDEIGGLLRALDGYQGSTVVRLALEFAPLVFVRPGELRKAEWAEIDWDRAQWRIPAEKMKMRDEHIVPLSRQALAVLSELHPLTGHGQFLFPSERTVSRGMSENTINAALRTLGFDKGTMTGHGFRAMASTRLNEDGWQPDVIERQLAHAQRNKVRAAYNRAQYLPERVQMMQAWADTLDVLRDDTGRVVLMRRARGE